MTAESTIQKQILLACSRKAARLFRINAGQAWTGRMVRNSDGSITLHQPRPFHGAPTGYPDLTGFATIEITPEMVGQKLAVFVAIEVKGPKTRISPEQVRFLEFAKAAGAAAGIARSTEDALSIIRSAGNPQTEEQESR